MRSASGSGSVSAWISREREGPRNDRQAPRQLSLGRRLTATASSLILPRRLPAATRLRVRYAPENPSASEGASGLDTLARNALVGEIKEGAVAVRRDPEASPARVWWPNARPIQPRPPRDRSTPAAVRPRYLQRYAIYLEWCDRMAPRHRCRA